MRFSFVTLALATLGSVSADVCMHNMRGSNNRLDEANRDRANGNRIFDSQNNNRGGYNVGNLYHYEGSELDLTWTNQHACGDSRSMCEVIIQYMCDPLLRDGTVTNTIPTDNNQCYNNNCDTDITFGRHESQQYYADCRYRKRNTGLFTSSQNLNGMGAHYTRQNPAGNRHGYECPEERDYYPYWAPSPWRDIAILTNFPERCESYRTESQNVKSRFYCWISQPLKDLLGKKQNNPWGVAPIEKTACEAVTGTLPDGQVLRGIWMEVPAFGIPAPYCGKSSWTRDNHLGNTIGGFPPGFNWTIPALSSMSGIDPNRCVLRVRYNITTGDFGDATRPLASGAGVFGSSTSSLVGNITSLYNRNRTSNEANRYPATNDIWSKYGLTDGAVSDSFQTTTNDPGNAEARRNTREYVVKNNPNVDFFGTLLPQGARGLVKTQLAINTAQYGRTFQDRSHRFAIRPAPGGIAGQSIHNLNVQGKRGNIVQVYPGVEYDFTPYRLHVPLGEYIHVQWTGSNTNPGNNAGQGVAGSDRHNMMMLVPKKYDEGQKETTPTTYGQWGTVYPNRIDSQRIGASTEQTLLGITDPLTLQHLAILDQPGGQFGGSMDELNDAGTYFDGGLIRASVLGIYHYLCTRNNNFSNRDQKGKIVISTEKVKTLALDSNAFFYSSAMGITSNGGGAADTGASIYVPASAGRDLSRFTWAEYPSSLSTSLSDVSSTYVQLSGIEGHGATLTLPYDGSTLSISKVYYAPSIAGPWSSTDASISNNQASVIASRDGVYVVQTKLNGGAVAGIVIGSVAFVALLITITVCMYRRRTGRGKYQVATHNAV